MAAGERQSNIELLRIIGIFGIIILHYNYSGIGGGFQYVEQGSLNENVLVFLESIAICGVNLFVMISGYFLSRTNQRSVGKALTLVIQVSIFRFLDYCICVLAGLQAFQLKKMIYSLIPLNWFVTLYIVLYLISPLINRAFKNLQSKNVLFGLIFLFSFVPTILDLVYRIKGKDMNSLMTLGTNGSGRGYTIVCFVLCYIIGAALNWIKIEKVKTWAFCLILLITVIVIFFWAKWDRTTAWEYCNPLVIGEAFMLLCLFLRVKMGTNRIINTIAKSTFGIYLIHQYVLPYLRIEQFVQKPVYIMLLHLLLSCIGTILFSFAVDWLYRLVMKRANKKLSGVWIYSI